MSKIAARLKELEITLPAPLKLPPGLVLPFPWVSVRGERVFVSGHPPLEADGSVAGPFGQVDRDVSVEDGYVLARKTGLAMLASLERELGDLDRISAWGRVFGMVNCSRGFGQHPNVINGFSELILEVFGAEVGRHARSAVGMAGLPFDMAVEIEAEVLIAL